VLSVLVGGAVLHYLSWHLEEAHAHSPPSEFEIQPSYVFIALQLGGMGIQPFPLLSSVQVFI